MVDTKCPLCHREDSVIEINGRPTCKNCPWTANGIQATEDVVFRLRKGCPGDYISQDAEDCETERCEAADEIERLRDGFQHIIEVYRILDGDGAKLQYEVDRLAKKMLGFDPDVNCFCGAYKGVGHERGANQCRKA